MRLSSADGMLHCMRTVHRFSVAFTLQSQHARPTARMLTLHLATRAWKGSLAMLIFVYAREIVLTGALIRCRVVAREERRDLAITIARQTTRKETNHVLNEYVPQTMRAIAEGRFLNVESFLRAIYRVERVIKPPARDDDENPPTPASNASRRGNPARTCFEPNGSTKPIRAEKTERIGILVLVLFPRLHARLVGPYGPFDSYDAALADARAVQPRMRRRRRGRSN